MEVAEDDVVDEDHRERRLPINPQPNDMQIAVEVSGDVVVSATENEGERQPGLEKGGIVGMLQLEEGESRPPEQEEEAGSEHVPEGPYQEDSLRRFIAHRRQLDCPISRREREVR